MKRSFLPLALCLTSACVDAPPPVVFDTEGWIDSAPPGQPNQKPDFTGGDEEDDDGDEESGAFMGIFGAFADGNLGEVEAEFFAESMGQELCIQFFEVSVVGPVSDCAACTHAWEFEFGATETELDVNAACSQGPGDINGQRWKLGIDGDNNLYRYDGEVWQAIGESTVEAGELFMEWEYGA